MSVNFIVMALIIYCCKDVLKKKFWLINRRKIFCIDNALKLSMICLLFIFLVKQFRLSYLNCFIVSLAFILVLIKSGVWYISFCEGFSEQLELNDFMIHLGMHFKENKRIETSLVACFKFSNPELQVEKLINNLKEHDEKDGILLNYHSHYLWKSLAVIMLNHEQQGDQDLASRIENLSNDILIFSQNVRVYQKEILSFIRKLNLACVLSIVIALISKNMLMQTINIESNLNYQSAMTVFLLSNLMILLLNHSLFKTKPTFVEECL